MPQPPKATSAPKKPARKTAPKAKAKRRSDAEISAAINDVLDNVRFYIQRDGGDLKFLGYKSGAARIEVLGACMGCALIDVTYKAGVETILRDEVPEVKRVEIVDRTREGAV